MSLLPVSMNLKKTISNQQKLYSLPKWYNDIWRFKQRPYVETSNLIVLFE
jgi:hypothetical protein